VKFSYRRSPTDEQAIEVDIVPLPEREGVYRVTVGEHVFELAERLFHQVAFCKDASEIILQWAGQEYHLFDASQRRRPTPTSTGDLRAPMAGKIIRILVRPGEQVEAGATLLILEAMKMEQQITAPQAGVVTSLLCHEGDQVTAGTELVVLEPAAVVPLPVDIP
jgi:3-methylcrotonyl-CoA carboxylase alpha subunit